MSLVAVSLLHDSCFSPSASADAKCRGWVAADGSAADVGPRPTYFARIHTPSCMDRAQKFIDKRSPMHAQKGLCSPSLSGRGLDGLPTPAPNVATPGVARAPAPGPAMAPATAEHMQSTEYASGLLSPWGLYRICCWLETHAHALSNVAWCSDSPSTTPNWQLAQLRHRPDDENLQTAPEVAQGPGRCQKDR